MTGSAATPGFGGSAIGEPDTREAARGVARLWWLWLIVGIAWIAASLVILQFDQASITTIGVIVGIMFVFASAQQFVLVVVADSLRWLWAIFGVLFLIAGVICFINPKNTFAGLADILGFLFLLVGVWWTIRAFIEKDVNPIWWLGLIAGILMVVLAFWTSGQFFIEKAYTLLVFAGIWAMMQGITDIVRAFQIRSLREV
ncbi:MAG: DUF308 domain-containing protein [Solirubrobacteraceae bacterium]|nr:DUF308 domain-containing protein [Solirubrobacteraceae bacterium]